MTEPPNRSGEDEPEADFGATLRYMGAIFGAIAILALIIGWLLTK